MAASASATAIIEDTLEVKQAKADFEKAFEAAKAGKHATLAPKPIASAYLADDVDVVLAKARSMNSLFGSWSSLQGDGIFWNLFTIVSLFKKH